jgi:hypothetical protein
MSSAVRVSTEKHSQTQLFTLAELSELRGNTLRYARSFPPGPERNQHRQIALSLRALFRNPKWLNAHTVEGSGS